MPSASRLTRRRVLRNSSALLAAAALPHSLFADITLPVLEVASAGSIRPLLEGPMKAAVATELRLDLQEHGGGADAVAHEILTGTLRPDLFVPVTATPMLTLLQAGLAIAATPIARSELVLTYSPKSRFVEQLAQAASGKLAWWEVLQQPGLKIGRGNPAADPGARCILFAMMLAEKKYKLPGLAQRLLGPALNPAQVMPNVGVLLKSGELDVSASYKVSAIAAGMPYIPLAPEINLSHADVRAANPEVQLEIEGKSLRPDPIIFYAAVLKAAPHPAAAEAFFRWLVTPAAQAIFVGAHYELPGKLAQLTA
ncbi:MAG: extracellular solute-binding protein [Acidobacteriaceae bacterium]|nr:extracellular solute-binding protein [Acidobacteriaceae bacterium]